MAKKYTGSLTLDWFNKKKSIVLLGDESVRGESDVPATRINWINKDEALFFEISESEGRGLTPYWVNINDIRVKEARPLVFRQAYSVSDKDKEGSIPGTDQTLELIEITNEEDANDCKSILVQGDNLLALNAIRKKINNGKLQKVRLVLIDPPYNTKKAFINYDDNFAHSEWLSLMRDRLVVLKDILSDDGVIAIHIDDKESAYVKILLDEIFGRENFLTTFIWETDGNSDNQAKVIGVHEYIHLYAKNEELFEHPSVLDPNLPENSKLHRDTIQNTIIKNGPKNPPSVVNIPSGFPAQFERGIIKKDNVEFPRYDQDLVIEDYKLINPVSAKSGWSSKALLEEFIQNSLNPITDGKGQKTDFSLKETGAIEAIKTRNKQYGYVISVLRNMGNTQKMGRELKDQYDLVTDFPKPEHLTAYLIKMLTNESDYVLDCFAGSGTTPAVALKLNRNFIAVELGKHAETHILKRLKGVIKGDDSIGISKDQKWKGGGSFKYYHVGQSIIKIDEETGKGEFNWELGKEFIQDSLLLSYDFAIESYLYKDNVQLFNALEKGPSIGRILGKSGQVIYGASYLASPNDSELSISNDEIKRIYSNFKRRDDFSSMVIFTNKGIDLAEDSVPADLEIIKVPHAIFAELER